MTMTPLRFIGLLDALALRARERGECLVVVTAQRGGVFDRAEAVDDGVLVKFRREAEPEGSVHLLPAEINGLTLHDRGLQAGRLTAKIATIPLLAVT